MTMELTESNGLLREKDADFVHTFASYLTEEQLKDYSSPGRLNACLEVEKPEINSLLALVGISRNESPRTVSKVLEIVATSFQADAITLWIPDAHRVALRSACHWAAGTAGDEELFCGLSGIELWPLEGLPGKVWAQGRSESIDELAEDRHIRRGTMLAKAGIRSLFAFPAKIGTETISVLELYARRRYAFHSNMRLKMDALSEQWGEYFRGYCVNQPVVE
jgi:hypothetical protein